MFVPKRHSFILLIVLTAIAGSVCFAASPAAPDHGGAANAEGDFLASLEAAQKSDAPDKEPPVAMTLVRFIVSLALVLGLAYATILGLKRFTSLKSGSGSSGRRIRVVENSQLGPNRTLHLVEVGGRRLLVASTPSQVSLISEITSDGDTREGEAPSEPGSVQPSAFKDQLALFLGSKNDSENVSRSVGRMLRDSSTFLQDGISRIGSLRRRLRDA